MPQEKTLHSIAKLVGQLVCVLAVIIISALVVLSVALMVSTLFTSVDVIAVLKILGVVALVGLAVGLPLGLRRAAPPLKYDIDRRDWRTPRLTLLEPIPSSRARTVLMRCQSGYLFVAAILLIVRVIQLATS